MCESRAERSERNDEEEDATVPAGTIVSSLIVARRPRCEVDVISIPKADLSSWEAGYN